MSTQFINLRCRNLLLTAAPVFCLDGLAHFASSTYGTCVEAIPESSEMTEEEYACGLPSLAGTVFGPAEFLDDKMKRFRHMNFQEYLAYVKKVDETEGFDVDGCTGCMPGRIAPLCHGCSEWLVAEKVTKGTVSTLREKLDKHIDFVALKKANIQPVRGVMYYLTFVGTTNQMEKTYKAKVWYYPGEEGLECQLLYFADESEENDLEALDIKYRLNGDKRRNSVVPFKNETIKPESVTRDAFLILVEELKRQFPQLKEARVMSIASKKWENYGYPRKRPYIDEAWIRFKKKHPSPVLS